MPYNQLQVPFNDTEIQRLNKLLSEVVAGFKTGAVSTREELLEQWNATISKFRETVGSKVSQISPIKPDTSPLVEQHNSYSNDIGKDLGILFYQLKILGEMSIGLYNTTLVQQEDLNGKLRRVASKLSDLKLYQDTDGTIISESFVTTNAIDVGSDKLSMPQCDVLIDEGAITLQLSDSKRVKVESVIVDPNTFNGVLGNNEQDTVHLRNELSAMLDINPDTWTEFEKTYFLDQAATIAPLQVDLFLKLSEKSIVNKIVIDPINFGTLDVVDVVDIKVTSDDKEWKSIKGFIPLASYLDETEDNTYVLNPSSSLYNGKLAYSFLPHWATGISIRLRKKSPFIFTNKSGINKYRMAIGIRSIDLFQNSFINKCELISSNISLDKVISKVAMLSAYRPENSSLATVKFFISNDDAITWKEIQPFNLDGFQVEELVSFESNSKNLRWRIVLERNDEAFNNAVSFLTSDDKQINIESTLVNKDISPAIISPIEQLNSESVDMLETLGPRGVSLPLRPELSLGTGTGGKIQITLPFSLLSISLEDVIVTVSGQVWTRVPSLQSQSSTSTVYELTHNGVLTFGDNVHGKAPDSGSSIGISLTPQDLHLVEGSDSYLSSLDLGSDGDLDTSILQRLGQPSSIVSYILPKNETFVNLRHTRIIPQTTLTSSTFQIVERQPDGTIVSAGVFDDEKGSLEDVAATGDFYVDYNNGKLYSFDPISSDNTTVISYRYFPVYDINNFSYVKDESGFSKISIPKESVVLEYAEDTTGESRVPYGWNGYEFPPTGQDLVSDEVGGSTIIRLSHDNIVKGTLSIPSGLFSSTPIEVEYFDGHEELYNNLKVQEEDIVDSSAAGIHIFTLSYGDTIFRPAGVVWSRPELFISEKAVGDPLASVGDWYINFATGEVRVRVSTAQDMGTVTYQYDSGLVSTDGRYSVNYRTGVIYCVQVPNDGEVISYRYTDYRLQYNIARVLPRSMFTIDTVKNQISLRTETLNTGKVKFLYEFIPEIKESIKDLVKFYSPLVRDIRIQVI